MIKNKHFIICLILVLALTMCFTACDQKAEVTLNLERVVVFETSSADVVAEDGTCTVEAFTAAKFTKTPESDAIIGFTDGTSTLIKGKKALPLNIVKNGGAFLEGDNLPEEAKGKEVLYLAFETEAILFVNGDIAVKDLLETLSMQTDIPFTFTASDGFSWATLDGADTTASVIKLEDGAVNVYVPSIPQGGSVRGTIYFVPGHTMGAASSLVK